MLRDSTATAAAAAAVVVVAVVVRTCLRAIPLAMVHMRKSIHGFPSVPLYGYGAPLGGHRPPELRLTTGSCFSVHYRVMEHLGSLESTKEA